MKKNEYKEIFICSNCGAEFNKWSGRCSECEEWDTLYSEFRAKKDEPYKGNIVTSTKPMLLSDIETKDEKEIRLKSGISEFDRALGGGVVKGSVVLLSGEPGIGKSTILLQICKSISKDKKILYVSGEESVGQIKLRAQRLEVKGENLYLLCETSVDAILSKADEISPDLLIIDSIQTTFSSFVDSVPGSVTQVKQCALSIIKKTKETGFSTVIVGHVNKDGGIAGPKVLEHMVDVVLNFEGDKSRFYRMIRATKNRYGSTNEIGVFEMGDRGLVEVADPSKALLSEKPKNIAGSCTVCVHEGSRPILAEIQALVSKTVFPSPKRVVTGLDYNRVSILLAVIEKRLGIYLSSQDVYLNVISGLRLDEPSSDLAVVLSIISAYRNIALDEKIVAVGEVGLLGEIRSVNFIESRIKEAYRLGYEKIIIPKSSLSNKFSKFDKNFEVVPVGNIIDILKLFS